MLEERVTLHSNFLEMSDELNVKMKCLAPLHLGDVNNFLIPPRTHLMYFYLDLKVFLIHKYTVNVVLP